jgi:KUP system potassium uptake protein
VLALLARVAHAVRGRPRLRAGLLVLGVVGAALFYGDAVLTPAISVLSAVEGLEVGTSQLKPYVVPLALGIIVALFAIQRHGTAAVGLLFGPICLAWFAALAVGGVVNIVRAPQVLAALHPAHALAFATEHGVASFVALGAVLLAITGAEALYADMGHFGRRAVRVAWFGLVGPALVLNYMGQGALLMVDPGAIDHPFYRAYPAWALYPLVALATAATVIASQATISGAFSLTRQAIQLGYLPRMGIRHTSAATIGQIYVPAINWLLLAAVASAVLGFGSSERLASAYGVAVMGTMTVTTLLTFFLVRFAWGLPLGLCIAATGAFLAVDLVFLAAALHKVLEGGWFPLALAGIVFVAMTTWRRGRDRLLDDMERHAPPLAPFLASLFANGVARVPGTAVFLTSTPDAVPAAFLHSLKHYKVAHQTNVFLTARFADAPMVDDAAAVRCERLGADAWRVTATFGFMQTPDVTRALALCSPAGLVVQPDEVSYFLSRSVPMLKARERGAWRHRLFAAMARNAANPSDYFQLPPNRVVELGTRVLI